MGEGGLTQEVSKERSGGVGDREDWEVGHRLGEEGLLGLEVLVA